jgi:hypothetical protein
MSVAAIGSAAAQYAARVDAVLAQRTRLRGPQPPGDLFAGLPASHPLMTADPRRALDPNLQLIASYVEPEDVIVDVGGGVGRVSLPLALRCRAVINAEPSRAMGAGFQTNAARAGITNAYIIVGDWLNLDSPVGTVALVNHVTYLTREIVPFIQKLERAGPRRVLITVNSPPRPSWNRVLYQLVHAEAEEVVPGHVELVNVLWEMGILPDVRVLLFPSPAPMAAPNREAAITGAVRGFGSDQWTLWPMSAELEQRLRHILNTRFDELFAAVPDGFIPRWIPLGREILITWQPQI